MCESVQQKLGHTKKYFWRQFSFFLKKKFYLSLFFYYFREDDEAQEYLQEVYERLDELGADTAESKASHILLGLQFDAKMQAKKCKDFSGKSYDLMTYHYVDCFRTILE